MTTPDANAEFLAGVGGEYVRDPATGNLTRPSATEPSAAEPPAAPDPQPTPSRPRP